LKESQVVARKPAVKTPKVIYLITRAHGLKTHLLKQEQFLRMLTWENVSAIYDLLLKTDYSEELALVSPDAFDPSQMERVFYQKLSQRLYFLLEISDGKIRTALESYSRKIEIENLRRITRALHSKEKISEGQLIPIPRKYQSINFATLIQAQSVREMVDLLRETVYRDLTNALPTYEKYANPLVIEAQASRICYELLWKNLRGIVDEDSVRELIGTEIDVLNIRYLFSFKYMNMEQDLLERLMIDIKYRLPRNIAQELSAVPYQNIPEHLTQPRYSEIAKITVDLIQRGKLNETETLFLQRLFSEAETLAIRNPNNLVYVFCYLEFCAREARNLTALIAGKQLKMEMEKIRTLLVL
jgi:vacuolar-type H+-ATPase subunit C/Vma6